jgi:hypothetical protein
LYFFLAIIINTSFFSPLSLSLLPSSWNFKFKEKEHVEKEPHGDLWRREVPCNSKQNEASQKFQMFLPTSSLPSPPPLLSFPFLLNFFFYCYTIHCFFFLDFCVFFIAIKLFNETPWQSSTIKLVISTCESQNMQCLFELTMQYPIHFHLCI